MSPYTETLRQTPWCPTRRERPDAAMSSLSLPALNSHREPSWRQRRIDSTIRWTIAPSPGAASYWRCRMLFLLCFVLALVIGAVHLYRAKQPRTNARVAEIFLLLLLVICVGVASVLTVITDAFFADRMAASLGWPAGNPFQSLVAFATLSVGVLGILCYWIRGNFWVATVIGFSIWCLGGGAVHIKDIVVSANYAPNNAGATPYMHILVPIVLIPFLTYGKQAGQ